MGEAGCNARECPRLVVFWATFPGAAFSVLGIEWNDSDSGQKAAPVLEMLRHSQGRAGLIHRNFPRPGVESFWGMGCQEGLEWEGQKGQYCLN